MLEERLRRLTTWYLELAWQAELLTTGHLGDDPRFGHCSGEELCTLGGAVTSMNQTQWLSDRLGLPYVGLLKTERRGAGRVCTASAPSARHLRIHS